MAVEEDGYELRWVASARPTTAHLCRRKNPATAAGRQPDWDATDNLLIKGDNLDALRLLRQNYFGQVKLIYIDPPTTRKAMRLFTAMISLRGKAKYWSNWANNADTIDYVKNIYGARTHSGWLSFMYPRLLLAKDLLRDDGVIFISIDDNEQAQLKLLCDEVFGEENFVAQFIWEHRKSGQNDADVSLAHNYKLVYSKDRTILSDESTGD